MPIRRVDIIANEPIILVTLEGRIAQEDILRDPPPNMPFSDAPTVCIVIDIRRSQVDFSTVLQLLKRDAVRARHDEGQGVFMRLFMVGSTVSGRVYADGRRLHQFGNEHIPFFDTPEEAVAAARRYLAERGAALHGGEIASGAGERDGFGTVGPVGDGPVSDGPVSDGPGKHDAPPPAFAETS